MKSDNQLIDPKYLKTNDLITYDAKQTGQHSKFRPFLVTNVDQKKQKLTIIPVTHSKPNPKSPYSRFHFTVEPNINQAINQATEDKENKQNYLDIQDQKEIPFSKFYKNGSPEILGNLANNGVKPNHLKKLKRNIKKKQFDIIKAYKQYNREIEQNGTVVNLQERREKKEVLTKGDLRKMQIAKEVGLKPKDPKAYDPVRQKQQKQKYQRPSKQQIKRDYGPVF